MPRRDRWGAAAGPNTGWAGGAGPRRSRDRDRLRRRRDSRPFRESYAGLAIHYIEAPDFESTNNIRSLWDARHYLDQDILLLEADVVFDAEVVGALLEVPGVAPRSRRSSVRCRAPSCIATPLTVLRASRSVRIRGLDSMPIMPSRPSTSTCFARCCCVTL